MIFGIYLVWVFKRSDQKHLHALVRGRRSVSPFNTAPGIPQSDLLKRASALMHSLFKAQRT